MRRGILFCVLTGLAALAGLAATQDVARVRLTVVPFRPSGVSAKVFGKEIQPGPCAVEVAKKINDALTHTGRFVMLNREFDADTLAELTRQHLENASAADASRLKRLQMTDCLVVGSVKVCDSPAVTTNPYTGTARIGDGPFLEISYRVVHAPTSQQRWANTVTIPYSYASGATADALLSSAYAQAARIICEEILVNQPVIAGE